MAAAHTATLTHEGEDTLIRIKGHLDLPDGPVEARIDAQTGDIILSVLQPLKPTSSFAEFIAFRDNIPKDDAADYQWNEFMRLCVLSRDPTPDHLISLDAEEEGYTQ